MSVPFEPKKNRLSFDSLVSDLELMGENLPDSRKGKNTQFKLKDAVLSAFSVFFTQSPSFLNFQRDMERTKGKNNALSQ